MSNTRLQWVKQPTWSNLGGIYKYFVLDFFNVLDGSIKQNPDESIL